MLSVVVGFQTQAIADLSSRTASILSVVQTSGVQLQPADRATLEDIPNTVEVDAVRDAITEKIDEQTTELETGFV